NRPLSSSLSPDASTERTSLSLHDALPISSLVLAGPRALAAAGGAMTELWQHGVAALSRLLARREVSPVELLEVALARIEKLNPALNAVVAVDGGASAEAERSAARWRAGTPLSPIDGIPFTVKENLLAAGLPAVWGSNLYRTHVPDRDELPVTRLRAAGAVVV